MKILITGSQGMLGGALQRVLKEAGHEILAADRDILDITNEEAIEVFCKEHAPEILINAAAYNAVDAAEGEGKEMAYHVNAMGPEVLARVTKKHGITFMHYSTDYVFDGEKESGAYNESDIPNPISEYGQSKLDGEVKAKAENPETTIMRVSKLFGEPGKSEGAKRSFVAIMLEKAHAGESLRVVDEEIGCPTFVDDIAVATREVITQDAFGKTYHFVNEGEGVTWYQFAEEIFGVAGLSPEMEAISGAEFNRAAKRPKATILLNTSKIKLPLRKDALERFIR